MNILEIILFVNIITVLIQIAVEDAIIGIVLLSLIAVILISLFSKHLRNKLEQRKNNYPHAYTFFLKKAQISKGNENLTNKDIKKLLSHKKNEWLKIEEVELQRIHKEEQTLKIIGSVYSDGYACWKIEHPYSTRTELVDSFDKIVDFDRRQKEYLSADEWEKTQANFSQLCRDKKSLAPHSGCYVYNIDFQKTNYKGDSEKGEYRIWQFFFAEFCTNLDLDYSNYKRVFENTINIEKHKKGLIEYPSYYTTEIIEFLKSFDTSIQLIVFGLEDKTNSQIHNLFFELCGCGFQVSTIDDLDDLSSNYVVIIDGITTQEQFVQRSKAVIQKFKNDKPCIVYFSIMKEYSREEMSVLIDKAKQEEQIKKEVEAISNALKAADIETAKEKVRKIKDFTQSHKVDKELADIINNAEEKVKNDYAEGLIDNYDTQYVDYISSHFAQDSGNWKYPVVKFPKYGNIVFPYRRRSISRRGFCEEGFQNYLHNIFNDCDLLILEDCSIHPTENNRPFEPDIAIICKQRPSIRIDIEIDEPYAGITRNPIHYIGSGDDFRDALLNNIGWLVIRFTEYQVFSNPKGCAALIAQVLHNIQPSLALPIALLSDHIPEEINRWTETEARVMASQNVREEYLNHKFGLVANGELEITDIKQTEKELACAKLVKPLMLETSRKNDNLAESIFYEKDSLIQFYPQEHIYLYNGQEQLSPVSNVVSCFFKPFDIFYWSEYKAKQRNVPQGQIIEEWDAKGSCSRDVGTFMHKQIENYYKGFPYQQEFFFKYDGQYVHIEEQISLEDEYMQFLEFQRNHKFKPFRTEWTIYDTELRIAGTIDMIHRQGDVFEIYDWKRSHRIVDYWGKAITINGYGERALGELNQIWDTPYWHYCLQQNMYRYILEKNYGIKIDKMFLVIFCNELNEYSKLEVPYMDEAIASIVNACKNGIVKNRLQSLLGENLS